MHKHIKAIVFLLLSTTICAQPSIDSLQIRQEIVKMLGIDTLISSAGAMTSLVGFSERDSRDLPGDIMIVTAEDIAAMGATDLLDVIVYMTATGLGRDVDDAIGVGVRGLWAQEGKILFMFNGIPLNDLDYGTYLLGGRLPLQMVSRIEFSFGPGSVKYGGTAALGVVNVVLKNNSEFSGGAVKTDFSYSNGVIDRSYIGFVGNYELNDNYKMTIQVNSGKMLKSTILQKLSDSTDLNWADSSEVNCNNVFIGLNKGKYRGSFYYSDFQSHISDEPQLLLMSTLGLDNTLNFKLSDRSKMELQLTYMDQLPWIDLNTTDSSLLGSNTHAQKINQSIVFKNKFAKNLDLDFGVQGLWQKSQILLRQAVFSYNEENSMRTGGGAVFFDGFYKGRWGAISLGTRLESHTFSRLLLAPRIGYSFQFEKFYFKSFAAQAFKIATIQNQNGALYTQKLNNETVTSFEVEMGFQIKTFYFKANAFKTNLYDPIIFVYDTELGIDNYINRDKIGTQGFQGNMQWKKDNFRFSTSAIFSKNINHPLVSEIQNNTNEMYFAFPTYKINAYGSFRVNRIWTFTMGGMNQGKVKVWKAAPIQNGVVLNAGITGQFFKNKNLQATFNVKNALNKTFWVASAIDLDIQPMPLLTRQFQLTLQYFFY